MACGEPAVQIKGMDKNHSLEAKIMQLRVRRKKTDIINKRTKKTRKNART